MKNRLRILAVIALLILSVFPLASCNPADRSAQPGVVGLHEVTQADGVRSVTINSRGTKLTVRSALSTGFVENNPRTTVYLFELPAGAGAELAGLEPVYSFRASAKSTWSAPLGEGSLTRLFCSYVLATKADDGSYTPVGVPVPVLNPEVLAPRAEAYPVAMSLKGLETGSVSDALSLGASQVVLDIAIEDFIATPNPADPASLDTTDYIFNGITYHFNTAQIRALDRKVATLSAESVIVYFRFTLNTHPADLPDKLACLGFADAPANARHYAINIDNEDCTGYMAALFGFFAERYTRPDRAYGFCGSFIIGSDVNDWSASNAAGSETDPQAYTDAYVRLTRLARTALVSNYAPGRVYISLGSNWNAPTDTPGGMSSSAFLAGFNATNTASGDYNWGVAASAQALDPADSSIWDDPLATGASSQYLSPANINVLTYALSKNYTFAGERRSVIVCSFGVSGDPADTSSLGNQAASYAYAYYKAAGDSDIDAFIYSPLCDSDTCNCGLYSLDGTKKPVCEVFASIDTKDDSPATAAAALAGSEFNYMYSNLSEAVRVKSAFRKEGTAAGSGKLKLSTVFDFTRGELSGFEPVCAGAGIDLYPAAGGPALRILGLGEAGVIKTGIDSRLLADAEYLVFDISHSSGEGTLTLRLSQNAKGGYLTCEATAACLPGSQTIRFDISEFAGAAARADFNLSLWLSPADKEAPHELMISSISAASEQRTAAPVLWIIVLSLLVFFILMIILALFSRLYHRIRRRRARKNSGKASTALTNREDA